MSSVADTKLYQALSVITDDRFGIIKELKELKRDPGAPNFFFYRGILSNISNADTPAEFPVTGGTSKERDKAMLKAAGEALERYGSLELHAAENWQWGTYDDIKNKTLHPSVYAVYNDIQYKSNGFFFKPFTAHSLHRWSSCDNASTGKETWVPSSFIYLPYKFKLHEGEIPIRQPISTGLAAHESFEQAALNGLCEIVERDGVMITWQAALTRPLVDIDSLAPHHMALIEEFERVGYSVQIICTTNDSTIPSFLFVLKGREYGNAKFALAGSANLDASVAIYKGLEELALIERAARNTILREGILPIVKGYTNIVEFTDHLRIWSNPKMIANADFLTRSTEKISLTALPNHTTGSLATDLQKAINLISNTGHTVLLKDITPVDLKSLGIYVVRSIVPGYQPLSRGYANRILGSKRLWTLPKQMGYTSKYTDYKDYPYPHPFA